MNWLVPAGRRGAAARFLLAAVVIILFTAATTAVAGLLDINQAANEIGGQPSLHISGVTIPGYGAPETLLLVGSDHRAGEPYSASNTDTMMLVRIDGSSQTINVLSVPRDLQVLSPGGGSIKLNATYSLGGTNLLLHTLKTQVFPGLKVNHVIDVNFSAFSDLIDAIGCVNADVDHRYYNDTALTNYSSIDIQPGYQRLCGHAGSTRGALAFVRFRHTDSDIVRNARQQDFLRWAKDNYTGSQLFSNRHELLRIFGRNAQTDAGLHSGDALESLIVLLANAAGHEIKSIPFPAQLAPCGKGAPCYVTADAASEAATYRRFMMPTQAAPKPKAATPAPAGPARRRARRHAPGVPAGLTADAGDGRGQAQAVAGAGLRVYYPKLIVSGSNYCSSTTGNCDTPGEPQSAFAGSYPRRYRIHLPNGRFAPSYRMTLVINSALGLYYGVQGTTWTSAPILAHGATSAVVGGRHLQEYFNGRGHLSLVAWRAGEAVYWISNTLTDSIPPSQMVAMAASFTRG